VLSERIVVAALGDSITAGTPYWDPDPAVQDSIGADLDPRCQWPYWAAENDDRLEFRNHGVNLERTDQIRSRLEDAVEGADVLVVQGGINDVVQGRPAVETVEDLRAMVRAGRDRGLRVVLVDVLPWNNGHPAHDTTINELNAAIYAMAAEENVSVIRFHDALEDPQNPGTMRPEWTNDGNHPSVEGHKQLGGVFQLPDA
jgi:lysophospholipase L1-like esterase